MCYEYVVVTAAAAATFANSPPTAVRGISANINRLMELDMYNEMHLDKFRTKKERKKKTTQNTPNCV